MLGSSNILNTEDILKEDFKAESDYILNQINNNDEDYSEETENTFSNEKRLHEEVIKILIVDESMEITTRLKTK